MLWENIHKIGTGRKVIILLTLNQWCTSNIWMPIISPVVLLSFCVKRFGSDENDRCPVTCLLCVSRQQPVIEWTLEIFYTNAFCLFPLCSPLRTHVCQARL